uniref:Uncharacterized protein n=1 Tax=Parascaris univalens TaxID=6257 RepID=A0A915BS38_PARUN
MGAKFVNGEMFQRKHNVGEAVHNFIAKEWNQISPCDIPNELINVAKMADYAALAHQKTFVSRWRFINSDFYGLLLQRQLKAAEEHRKQVEELL